MWEHLLAVYIARFSKKHLKVDCLCRLKLIAKIEVSLKFPRKTYREGTHFKSSIIPSSRKLFSFGRLFYFKQQSLKSINSKISLQNPFLKDLNIFFFSESYFETLRCRQLKYFHRKTIPMYTRARYHSQHKDALYTYNLNTTMQTNSTSIHTYMHTMHM